MQLDRFAKLVNDCQLSVSVLGNVQSGDYELVAHNTGPDSPEITADRRARQLTWLGVLGVAGGVFRSEFDDPLDSHTVSMLAASFGQFVAAAVTARQRDPGADWLHRLYNLPDTRTEGN